MLLVAPQLSPNARAETSPRGRSRRASHDLTLLRPRSVAALADVTARLVPPSKREACGAQSAVKARCRSPSGLSRISLIGRCALRMNTATSANRAACHFSLDYGSIPMLRMESAVAIIDARELPRGLHIRARFSENDENSNPSRERPQTPHFSPWLRTSDHESVSTRVRWVAIRAAPVWSFVSSATVRTATVVTTVSKNTLERSTR